MLKLYQHDAVTELRFHPTFLGQPLYQVSAFYFDGTLIDTGTPRSSGDLARWTKGQRVDQVLLTHHHEDHVGGVAVLTVPVFAPAGSLAKITHPVRIPLYRRWVWGQPRPGQAHPLPNPLTTANHTLQPISTPGQATPHVAYLVPDLGLLFSGDLFISQQAKYIRRRDDLGAWFQSLRRVLTYDFHTLFCAHAGAIPQAKTALQRKLAYWESLHEQTHTLAQQGYPAKVIRDKLLGKENRLTLVSSGRFSKLNLIQALLTLPKNTAQGV